MCRESVGRLPEGGGQSNTLCEGFYSYHHSMVSVYNLRNTPVNLIKLRPSGLYFVLVTKVINLNDQREEKR